MEIVGKCVFVRSNVACSGNHLEQPRYIALGIDPSAPRLRARKANKFVGDRIMIIRPFDAIIYPGGKAFLLPWLVLWNGPSCKRHRTERACQYRVTTSE